MIEENLNFDGVDEICCSVENLSEIENISDLLVTSISSPL